MSVREYIGARYVPIFGRKDETSIAWDDSKPYEPLTIVLYQGNSYTSRQYVPAGIPITNEAFWALTGNYNAQVEAYRAEVRGFNDRITGVETGLDSTNDKIGDGFTADNTVADAVAVIGDGFTAGDTVADAVAGINGKIGDGFTADNTVADQITGINDVIGDGFTAGNTVAKRVNFANFPDTLMGARPVIRTIKSSGNDIQTFTAWPLPNPQYAAVASGDGSNVTGLIKIYDLNSGAVIATLNGTFYHPADITYYNGSLYISAGNQALVTVVNVSTPSSPRITRVIDTNEIITSSNCYSFGKYKDGWYIAPNIYGGVVYALDSNMKNPTPLFELRDMYGMYQGMCYNAPLDCFIFLTSTFGKLVYYSVTGEILKTVNLKKAYQFIPVQEAEGICSYGEHVWFNNNPSVATPAGVDVHGAIWHANMLENFNNSEMVDARVNAQLNVTLTDSASGLNTENDADGNRYPGINATYPLMIKYPEDLITIPLYTNNRIYLRLEKSCDVIVPFLHGDWYVNQTNAGANQTYAGFYISGANVTFVGLANAVSNLSAIKQEFGSTGLKCLFIVRNGTISILNGFGTQLATGYRIVGAENGIVIKQPGMPTGNIHSDSGSCVLDCTVYN